MVCTTLLGFGLVVRFLNNIKPADTSTASTVLGTKDVGTRDLEYFTDPAIHVVTYKRHPQMPSKTFASLQEIPV